MKGLLFVTLHGQPRAVPTDLRPLWVRAPELFHIGLVAGEWADHLPRFYPLHHRPLLLSETPRGGDLAWWHWPGEQPGWQPLSRNVAPKWVHLPAFVARYVPPELTLGRWG